MGYGWQIPSIYMQNLKSCTTKIDYLAMICLLLVRYLT